MCVRKSYESLQRNKRSSVKTPPMSIARTRAQYLADLHEQYRKRLPLSEVAFKKGAAYFPNGLSQAGRYCKPFPPVIASSSGANITTVDNVRLVDFWQGHFCNILGHNPEIILDALNQSFTSRRALQLGLVTDLEEEVATELCTAVNMDSCLFTTSGALATMYAALIGMARTNRHRVLKIQGGWHGAQPWSFKDVKQFGAAMGECAGLSESLQSDVLTVPFNDSDALNDCFRRYGDEIAVLFLELVLGNSGMIMANPEFVRLARDLSSHHGALLVVDELVTGFRMCSGGLSSRYGIEPDVATYGKAISGGMPFACITARRDVLDIVSAKHIPRVWADVGTFTSHPATLVAVLTMLLYLKRYGDNLYTETIARMGQLRARLRDLFATHGVDADVTGASPAVGIPNCPIGTVRFPIDRSSYDATSGKPHWDHSSTDVQFRDEVCRLGLMLRGVYCWQGLGVMTLAHSDRDVASFIEAYDDFLVDSRGAHPVPV